MERMSSAEKRNYSQYKCSTGNFSVSVAARVSCPDGSDMMSDIEPIQLRSMLISGLEMCLARLRSMSPCRLWPSGAEKQALCSVTLFLWWGEKILGPKVMLLCYIAPGGCSWLSQAC